MTGRAHWRDAEAAAGSMTESDRRALLLLTRLPFLWEGAIERLYGLRGDTSIYRCLARLRAMGLIDAIRPVLRAERNPSLFYLTDLGIATIAVDQQVDPRQLVDGSRLRGADLLERLPGLPHLLATYQLLVALAAARDGRIDLLSWDQPWRRSFYLPTRKARIAVKLPAHAVVSWGDEATACFLLPDLATFPLRVHLETLRRLSIFRQVVGGKLPTIIVATTDARRSAWIRTFDDVARWQQDAPLTARVVSWGELGDDASVLCDVAGAAQPSAMRDIHRPRLRPLGRRQPGSSIPRPVGTVLQPGSAAGGLGRLALALTSMERSLLDVVGRHPFLPAESLATVFGWDVRRLRARRARLVRLGLVRLLDVDTNGTLSTAALAELTRDGLELVAAQQGLSLARAVRFNGVAGGGPDQPTGSRRLLLRNLDHTRGVDAIFVELIRTLGATAVAEADRLLEWRNAVACSRRRMRPDGYGMIRRDGKLHGFFLEFDRGTMSARDYGEKWAAYYDYRDSRAFERDYDGFPTILVVTTDNASEERIARSARAAAVGRWPSLPLLLTCEWRTVDDPTNADGLLGRIWREPHGSFAERRQWPSISTPARRSDHQSVGQGDSPFLVIQRRAVGECGLRQAGPIHPSSRDRQSASLSPCGRHHGSP